MKTKWNQIMNKIMKKYIRRLLNSLGWHITSNRTKKLIDDKSLGLDKLLLTLISTRGINTFSSKGQLKQDIMALIFNDFKKSGYFVEFGAAGGINLSNTYLLEKELGWTGILSEPSIAWHDELHKNRKCYIDTRCVWKTSGDFLEFQIVEDGELSTLTQFSKSDQHAPARLKSSTIMVETVSLEKLLDDGKAPKVIDYLSIDTEGSEFEILKGFDFNKYKFNFITVEHNYTENREKILKLLELNSYERVLPELSQWDDWYVPRV